MRSLIIIVALLSLPLPAHAQPQPSATPKPAGSVKAAPSPKSKSDAKPRARGAAAAGSAEALPPGHPPTGEMPPGHPPSGGGGPAGMFQPKPNRVLVDPKLPPGTVEIRIVDANEQFIPNAEISLTVLENSVTKGESTEVLEHKTDGEGFRRFTDLRFGTGVSYTVKTKRGPATFISSPFGLKDIAGVRVLLHAYEPVTELATAAFVIEAVMMLEIKEDSFSVSHRLRTLNVGRKAFVASGVSIPLPEGYKAFNNEDATGDAKMIERDGMAVLQGTFPPGQNEVFYRYQVPLSGSSEQQLRLPLPPRVVHTTVLIGAAKGMGLKVAGFPEAQPTRWQNGQRVLRTAKEPDMRGGMQGLLANSAPGSLDVTVSGIPTPGPYRWLALVLAGLAMVGGAFQRFQKRTTAVRDERREDLLDARATLLEELATLERARREGEVGPKSYARLRAALLDAFARIMLQLDQMGHVEPMPASAPEVENESAKRAKKAKLKKAPKAKDDDTVASTPRKRRRKSKNKRAPA
jgi:hypothetical protein